MIKLKSIISIILAAAVSLCLGMSVFAEEDSSEAWYIASPVKTNEDNILRSVNGNISGGNNAYINTTGTFYVDCTGSSVLADVLITVVSTNQYNDVTVVIYRPDKTYLFTDQALTFSGKQNQKHYTVSNLTAGTYKVDVFTTNGGASVSVYMNDYYNVYG